MSLEMLTTREQEILETVIHQFLLTGNPVGSRTISKKRKDELSPASVRNVMADLEERGYLNHPHTSAGRVPTTKGYRHYVDNLIKIVELTEKDKELIRENIGKLMGDVDLILEKTSHVIARISNQLGLILTPKFDEGVLEKLDIISVSSDKILVILSIKDGIARTILLEVEHHIPANLLTKTVQLLNERLSGVKIREIKNSIHQRVKDLINEKTGIVRLFIESADKLFNYTLYANLKYTGTTNILSNPEFADIVKFSALIELLEEKNIIIHMMEKRHEPPGLKITIGDENEEKPIQECSIITAPYTVGNVEGIVGVIGPMRMAYKRIIPLVDFTAQLITQVFHESKV
jgi:heat-inducible transcriptional repressor